MTLLFRGTPWFPRIALAVGLLGTGGLVVAGAVEGWPVRGLVILGGVLLLATLGLWGLLRRAGHAAAAWATEDALVVHRPGRPALRIPWSEIAAGTWAAATRQHGDGPAIRTTTGGPYDRPNPDHWTLIAAPILARDWMSGARAMRDEFERRGIPWQYDVDPRSIEPNWTSSRWNH